MATTVYFATNRVVTNASDADKGYTSIMVPPLKPQEITYGAAVAVLVGGAESYLDADTLEWLDERERLHSENNIYGFCPGEAAAFILLAKQAQDTPMEIAATGLGREANRH